MRLAAGSGRALSTLARQRSTADARASLVERLRARRAEIEEAILTRTYSVADPTEVGDPVYVEGLRTAVSAAIVYSLLGIEDSQLHPAAIPGELLAQARQAARNRVSLATVLRRYVAGYSVLGDFLTIEVERDELFGAEDFHHLMRAQAELFDRLIAAVTEEHEREAAGRTRSPEQRRAACIQGLLAGERPDTSELAYDFDAWHLGVIAAGGEAEEAIREAASVLGRRPLVLDRGEGVVWAWLGGRRPALSEELDIPVASAPSSETSLAVGEPAQGLVGWRLTHRQASAALPIALRSTEQVTRYADVSLLASMLQDEVLIGTLHDLYLKPLARQRDEGETLRATLRAYFAAERNVSSTAAALEVSRQTVANRLRAVEDSIGRSVNATAMEIDAALQLHAIDAIRGPGRLT